jgi:hypothetical protein
MGGLAAPVGHGNEPKNTGARSARARTRGQNQLVFNITPTYTASLENLPKTVCKNRRNTEKCAGNLLCVFPLSTRKRADITRYL